MTRSPFVRPLRFAASLLLLAPCAAAPGDCSRTPHECALEHYGRRDFAAAIRILEQQLAAEPGNLKALNLLGIALTGAGRVAEANRRFQKALALDPGFTPALKNLAVNEFTLGRLSSARVRFEEVLARTPDDAIAHVHLAEIHHRRKEYAAALRHYERSGDRVAENPNWTLHHAQALLQAGRGAEAVAVLARLTDGDADSLFQAGVLLGQAKSHAEAARFFGLARTGYRDPYAAGYNQVLMLIRGGDHAAALRVGEELLAGRPPAAGELHNLLSQAYLGAGRLKEAYDSLRTATRLEPKVEENYLDLATICLEHENFDLGLEIVDIGLLQRPESVRLHLQRGVLLAMKGMVEAAETEFARASTLAPESTVPSVALAMTWMQTGQTDRAVQVLREKARKGRKDPIVLYMLGLALMRSGAEPGAAEGVEAAAAFEAAVRLKPDYSPARAELGKLLLKGGDVAKAITQLERAVSLDATSVPAAYALAQAYRRSGQTGRAAEMMALVNRHNTQEREPDSADELKRMVFRIVREGTAPPAPAPR